MKLREGLVLRSAAFSRHHSAVEDLRCQVHTSADLRKTSLEREEIRATRMFESNEESIG